MPFKPSDKEEEYFARQQVELKRKLAEEARRRLEAEQRERARQLHYMKCPKCGMDLQEIGFSDVRVDKCFSCGGLWLDEGELDRILDKEAGFLRRLRGLFG